MTKLTALKKLARRQGLNALAETMTEKNMTKSAKYMIWEAANEIITININTLQYSCNISMYRLVKRYQTLLCQLLPEVPDNIIDYRMVSADACFGTYQRQGYIYPYPDQGGIKCQ